MAKKLKIKLPKRVVGVKIPKSVRKGPIAGFLNSTAGQIVIAEALVAAGGALAFKGTDPASRAGGALRHPIGTLKHAGLQAADQGARLSFALSEALRAFRAALDRDDWEQARATSASDKQLDVEEKPVGKKKPSTTTPPAPH